MMESHRCEGRSLARTSDLIVLRISGLYVDELTFRIFEPVVHRRVNPNANS